MPLLLLTLNATRSLTSTGGDDTATSTKQELVTSACAGKTDPRVMTDNVVATSFFNILIPFYDYIEFKNHSRHYGVLDDLIQ